MANPSPAWSYSRVNAFNTCPKQFWHLNIEKDFRALDTEAQKDGNDLHKAMEMYFNHGKPLSKRFAFMSDVAEMLARSPGTKQAEVRIALTTDLEYCDFFAKETWARAIIDLMIISPDGSTATIIDWKTGKNISDDFAQNHAAAALLMAWKPEITTVHMGYYWTKHRQLTRKTVTRADLKHLWNAIIKMLRPYNYAHHNHTFEPRPSGLCKRHCPVKTCVHNGAN